MSQHRNTEPSWVRDIRRDVATWPHLSAEQIGVVVRAFANDGSAARSETTGDAAMRNVLLES